MFTSIYIGYSSLLFLFPPFLLTLCKLFWSAFNDLLNLFCRGSPITMLSPNLKSRHQFILLNFFVAVDDTVLCPSILKRHFPHLAPETQHQFCLSSLFLNIPLAILFHFHPNCGHDSRFYLQTLPLLPQRLSSLNLLISFLETTRKSLSR